MDPVTFIYIMYAVIVAIAGVLVYTATDPRATYRHDLSECLEVVDCHRIARHRRNGPACQTW